MLSCLCRHLGGDSVGVEMNLTALKINSLSCKGRYSDGGGLYLLVSESGFKSWVFRYQIFGKRKDMGLGGYPLISLKRARLLRDEQKVKVNQGIDPLKQRDQNRLEVRKSKEMTFEKATYLCYEAIKDTWKNPKQRAQWLKTLETYTFPFFGPTPMQDLSSERVAKALKPIWLKKAETARRVRQRVEKVYNWAKVMKYCSGDNPAVLKGNLEHLLPKQPLMHQNHHKALEIAQLPEFWRSIQKIDGYASLALQFLILTATRTSEVLKAEWREIDEEQALWIIPAERMKTGRAHRVPLSSVSLRVLLQIKELSTSERYVFSLDGEKPLSNMVMLSLIRKRFSHLDATPHGFRSTFRDWGETSQAYSIRSLEYCLSHTLKNKVEAAYQRNDLLLERRKIMEDWSSFIARESEIIRFQKVS